MSSASPHPSQPDLTASHAVRTPLFSHAQQTIILEIQQTHYRQSP